MSAIGEPALLRRDLAALLHGCKVIVCLGTGGVGKTTVAAGLSLFAALEGKRTLCLTIDPARRLAQCFGKDAFSSQVEPIDLDRLAGARSASGSLSIQLLDAGLTFDELVQKHASSDLVARRILEHPVYRHLSRHTPGTRSYMAMERVNALMSSGEFDLIILDTPPSDRVLEFFDAPSRMTEIMDSPLTKILSRGARLGGKALAPWVEGGMRRLVRKVGQVTSTSMLEEIGALLASLAEMFGGFSERARRVETLFHGDSFRSILISTPTAIQSDLLSGFLRDLEARSIAVHAVLLNRVRAYPGFDWDSAERLELETTLGAALVERLEALACEEAAQVSLDRKRVADLRRTLAKIPLFGLPALGPELSGPEHLLGLLQVDPLA